MFKSQVRISTSNRRFWLGGTILLQGFAVLFACLVIAQPPEFAVHAASTRTVVLQRSQIDTITLPDTPTAQEIANVADALLDAQLRAIIAEQGLTGNPSRGHLIPSIDSPLAQLGKKLFFSKALGGDMDTACATCHLPTLGGGDGLSLPIGVGAHNPDLIGPGRTHPSGGPTVPRNSPTTFNIAFWDRVMFWDGRIESIGKTVGANGADGLGIRTPESAFGIADPYAGLNLAMAQARFPVTSKEEMRGFDFELTNNNADIRNRLAGRLGNYGLGVDEIQSFNSWQEEFESVFGTAPTIEELITEHRIAQAIGEYERSQVFINTPWQAYIAGNRDAIDPAAKQGALLFYRSAQQGGGGCYQCHQGDFFTDEKFHVLAIPQLGPGKGDRLTRGDDFGRFRESHHLDDLYAFRTPSLLNVEVTGPYGHDGAYTTLEGIVRHHLNPAQAVATYDFTQLDPTVQTEHCVDNTGEALAQLEKSRAMGILPLQDIHLYNQEIAAIVAFLHTLTDPCVEDAACLAPWMPSAEERDPDGLRLLAITQAN